MRAGIIRQRTPVRQQQIIEAVRELIISRGMESVTIGAIAHAVGLTEGAIYRHFTSKHQILSLLVDDIERDLLDTVERAQAEGASALENLRHILEAHLSRAEDGRGVSFIVIAEAMSFEGIGLSGRVSMMLTRYLERIRRVLALGIEEGSVRRDVDLDAAATAFFGLVQSTATLWVLNEYAPPLAERRLEMWDIYRRGVAALP